MLVFLFLKNEKSVKIYILSDFFAFQGCFIEKLYILAPN